VRTTSQALCVHEPASCGGLLAQQAIAQSLVAEASPKRVDPERSASTNPSAAMARMALR
jgi:hypothetical protein